MAEDKAAPVPAVTADAPGEGRRKTVVVVGVDDSDHSYHALEWTVRHVAAGAELVVVHAKPPPSSVVSFGAPDSGYNSSSPFLDSAAAGEVLRYVESDLRKTAEEVVERARRLCIANSVHALVEVIEGEPKYVLCNAVEKHHADLLVVGSHGYGAIKRAFLGSVSDYCAHHALCSVMIVKQQPKSKKK